MQFVLNYSKTPNYYNINKLITSKLITETEDEVFVSLMPDFESTIQELSEIIMSETLILKVAYLQTTICN